MAKIIGRPALPNMPWQDKPEGFTKPVWRYDGNPIIQRDAIPTSNSVFNSAVVTFGDAYAGVFRCDNRGVEMDIFAGFSKDGIHWDINPEPIVFEGEKDVTRKEYRYDPRVCFIEDRYYVTWCNGYHAPPSASATPTTLRPSTSWRTPFCPTTATACSSPGR